MADEMVASLRAMRGMQALGLLPPTRARRREMLRRMLTFPHPYSETIHPSER